MPDHPTKEDAEEIADRYDKDEVIIFHVGDGMLGYASYGRTSDLCDHAKRLADAAYDAMLNIFLTNAMLLPMSEEQADDDTDAGPTPGPAYADERYVVANPENARPNGEVILSPSGYGNDLPGAEQRANAQLAATAFNAAHELPDEYDPVAAVEALPQSLRLLKAVEEHLEKMEGKITMSDDEKALLTLTRDALQKARRDDESE